MDFEKDNLYQGIVLIYMETGSVKETASRLNTYPIKVRRVLLTEGLWRSHTSDEIGDLWQQGKSVSEIAEKLCISEKNVQSYLPYTRGRYRRDNKSNDAVRSSIYRERMQMIAGNQVKIKECSSKLSKKGNIIMENNNSEPICLHLALKYTEACEENQALIKYGKVKESISRDVLVPGDITLHVLNYVIQKLFGWQNSHLHSFSIPKEIFEIMTKDKFDNYGKLCGVYYRFPTEDYEDLYWDDDYKEGQSFNTWLRKKYKGPYRYGGQGDYYFANQKKIKEFCERFKELEPKKQTLSGLQNKIMFEAGMDCLLERLLLSDVLIIDKNAEVDIDQIDFSHISDTDIVPVAKELIYEYDYGDGWEVTITVSDEKYTEEEIAYIKENYMPLCIKKDGLSVLDDVGGVGGYCDFLSTIHEAEEDEREDMKVWARYMGWTGRNVRPQNML